MLAPKLLIWLDFCHYDAVYLINVYQLCFFSSPFGVQGTTEICWAADCLSHGYDVLKSPENKLSHANTSITPPVNNLYHDPDLRKGYNWLQLTKHTLGELLTMSHISVTEVKNKHRRTDLHVNSRFGIIIIVGKTTGTSENTNPFGADRSPRRKRHLFPSGLGDVCTLRTYLSVFSPIPATSRVCCLTLCSSDCGNRNADPVKPRGLVLKSAFSPVLKKSSSSNTERSQRLLLFCCATELKVSWEPKTGQTKTTDTRRKTKPVVVVLKPTCPGSFSVYPGRWALVRAEPPTLHKFSRDCEASVVRVVTLFPPVVSSFPRGRGLMLQSWLDLSSENRHVTHLSGVRSPWQSLTA